MRPTGLPGFFGSSYVPLCFDLLSYLLTRHVTDLRGRSRISSGGYFIAHAGDGHLAGLVCYHVESFLGHRILYLANDVENFEDLAAVYAVVRAHVEDQC